jgi:hypothetical protein
MYSFLCLILIGNLTTLYIEQYQLIAGKVIQDNTYFLGERYPFVGGKIPEQTQTKRG